MYYNATYEDMTAPSQGPVNPFSSKSAPGGGVNRQNTLTGHVEAQAFDDKTFDDEHRSFNVLGYAHNPSILTAGGGSVQEFVGDLAAAQKSGGEMLALQRPTNQKVRATKRKRLAKGQLGEFDDEDDEEEAAQGEGEEGAGGGEEGSSAAAGASKKRKKEQKEYIGPWAGWEDDGVEAQVGAMIPPPGEDEDALEEAPRERRRKPIIDRGRNEVGYGQEKSVFHGALLWALTREQGRLRAEGVWPHRQGLVRLSWALVPTCPDRRGCQLARRVGHARVLCPEEVHPHLVGPHQGRQRVRALPWLGPPHPLWLARLAHQTLGRLPRGQVPAHVHGPWPRRPRRQLQQQGQQLPLGWL